MNRRLLLAGLVLAAALALPFELHYYNRVKLANGERSLREQERTIGGLLQVNQALYLRLAARAEVRNPLAPSNTNDWQAELAELGAKAEMLRLETNQIAMRQREERRGSAVRGYTEGDFNLLEHSHGRVGTSGLEPRHAGKVNDAIILASFLRHCAHENSGSVPRDFEELGSYLAERTKGDDAAWRRFPFTGTNNYEIVYQGSLNDLSGISLRRVAILRERHGWQSPEGKWARVYAYADGYAQIIESDDNFRSWDAQHIIPP
jgi:hypothetical protein